MNILFLSEVFYPHGGGAELATYRYAKLLSENGLNVKVVTNKYPSEPDLITEGKLAVYRLPLFHGSSIEKYKILFNLGVPFSNFFKKLIAWADIVYIPRYWFSAIPIAKAYGKPVLVHLHDYVLVCPLHGLYDFSKGGICQSTSCSAKCIFAFERNSGRSLKSALASTFLNSTVGTQLKRLIELSDGIVCVSNAQKTLICSRIPKLEKKIKVIYNPLPIGCYPIQSAGDDYGFLGGPNPIKGFQVLRCALNEIAVNIKIRVHAARFNHSSGSKPAHESLKHADIIYYGNLNLASLNELYEQLRAIVFPSICPEPLPYAISETILKSRLVIASDTGGSPEIGKDCKGVFFFESGNTRELAEKIEYVAALDKDDVGDLSAQSREIFLKNFKDDIVLKEFVNLCHRLVSFPNINNIYIE
jgi:glycosyltransferase involved in cell wall biosynthesis